MDHVDQVDQVDHVDHADHVSPSGPESAQAAHPANDWRYFLVLAKWGPLVTLASEPSGLQRAQGGNVDHVDRVDQVNQVGHVDQVCPSGPTTTQAAHPANDWRYSVVVAKWGRFVILGKWTLRPQ